MTLILKLDIDMVKMYHHTKKYSFYVNWFKNYSLNRDTHTHTHTDTMKELPLPHTREVKIPSQTVIGKLSLPNLWQSV